jgi:hypothetical protein
MYPDFEILHFKIAVISSMSLHTESQQFGQLREPALKLYYTCTSMFVNFKYRYELTQIMVTQNNITHLLFWICWPHTKTVAVNQI